MAIDPKDDPKSPRPNDALALMESPLYWTMKVRERLALVQQVSNSREDEGPGFREKILTWIRTGVLEKPDKP